MKDLHLRVSEETIEQIKQAAQKDSRTVSAMARKILEDYFKKPTSSVQTPNRIDEGSVKNMLAFFEERKKAKEKSRANG